ncbi:MAG: histidine--tRNA ligase [Clostridia bacterium]|nr:histidine--tRNA ligase [Clostridia bacterium]
MKNFNPIRGTYDYLPADAKLREILKNKILSVFQNNGYNLIGTPIFEHLELLNGSDGGDNLKLMFKTIKRGEKLDLTKENLCENDIVEEGLRYDLTVPLARFYSNNREKLPTPFKAIQIDNVFRAERPQKGRNRQFMQCDIDVFGDASINAELELLKTAIDAYQSMGFNTLTLKINDRRILNNLLLFAGFTEDEIGTVCVSLDKLDKIAVSGVVMELIEKGMEAEKINKLVDILNDVLANGLDCVSKYGVEQSYVDNIKYLINTLQNLTSGHNIEFNISIVRGQGYYTGTVYEFYADGFAGAIGGGGRYDKMVGKMTGNDVCAVGVSIGFERVALILKERGITFGEKENLALIYDNDDEIIKVFEAKAKLMEKFNVSLYLRPKNMKNFYDKIVEVATNCISFKEYSEGKEIKKLAK